ncbi:MAG: 30S ribosomal protein S20 [Planctomycetaceae bacterium]|jgi:small subunit ribosomal protein S20
MPNSVSAKKSLRQNQKRRILNRQQRSRLRTEVKRFRSLMEQSPSRTDADTALTQVTKIIDKAAAKRLIHRNTASRTKSRLAALKKSVCS